MFETVLKTPAGPERHQCAPPARERELFIQHFRAQGHSDWRTKSVNSLLLQIATHIEWHDGAISLAELKTAAERWIVSRDRHHEKPRSAKGMKQDFASIGTQWLRFMGRFAEVPPILDPFDLEVTAFLRFLDEERGLAAYTLAIRKRSLQHFLSWLSERGGSVSGVTPRTITDYFSVARQWKRETVKLHVCTLRSFFRFAASKRWVDSKLATTIDAPRIYSLEGLPQGLKWPDVQRLIAGLSGTDPTVVRDRAAIILLALYGLRMNEVIALTLDDIDWSGERLNVHRSKQRKHQQFPLCAEAGDAIIRYLREVRPRSTHRELFLTLHAPHKPFGRCGLSGSITARIRNLGVPLARYGPHSLRHACATHLLAQGFSFKEIGDHLGHRSTQSTRIYAKVDMVSLRQVGDFGLSDLESSTTPVDKIEINGIAPQKLAALRELANLGIGGVA
jgi:site-specific recombinase XerD